MNRSRAAFLLIPHQIEKMTLYGVQSFLALMPNYENRKTCGTSLFYESHTGFRSILSGSNPKEWRRRYVIGQVDRWFQMDRFDSLWYWWASDTSSLAETHDRTALPGLIEKRRAEADRQLGKKAASDTRKDSVKTIASCINRSLVEHMLQITHTRVAHEHFSHLSRGLYSGNRDKWGSLRLEQLLRFLRTFQGGVQSDTHRVQMTRFWPVSDTSRESYTTMSE